ncbi:hypothetical protein ACO3TA_00395 [Methanocaldococcus sp. 28A]
MDDNEIEERLEVLSKKILEIEKRVDAKLINYENKLNKKIENNLKNDIIIFMGMYLRTIDEFKKILSVIKTYILIINLLIVILYFLIIIILIKVFIL